MTAPELFLEQAKLQIHQSLHVVSATLVREKLEEDAAYYQFRLLLIDGSRLDASARAEEIASNLSVTKYRFHWQDSNGDLIARWDNAPHHRRLSTFPDHIHDGGEANIQPHAPVSIADVLAEIDRRLREK